MTNSAFAEILVCSLAFCYLSLASSLRALSFPLFVLAEASNAPQFVDSGRASYVDCGGCSVGAPSLLSFSRFELKIARALSLSLTVLSC